MAHSPLPFDMPVGAYPERAQAHISWLDRQGERISGILHHWQQRISSRTKPFLHLVEQHESRFGDLAQDDLLQTAQALRFRLRKEGLVNDAGAQSFALIRLASQSILGWRHYDVQILGGRALLQGLVAEMQTGEGKTLTATLPACTAALAGIPVHIITVNDYLAARDATTMGPLYRSLGLTVGTIQQGMPREARQAAYACDITYCTNKEVAFDYLKDRITLGRRPHRVQLQLDRVGGVNTRSDQLLLRGLHFGIVDEADSVLIDEARTPLIISGPSREHTERQLYEQAFELADQLLRDQDFVLDEEHRSIRITPQGSNALAELSEPWGGLWKGQQRREHLVGQALSARHVFSRDKEYLVRNEKVQIIDPYTGRVMPDRSWEHGLQQMIEVKESCPLSARRDPVARITYQRFFCRYLRLAGMTGTAREVRGELRRVYGLASVRIPTNRKSQRYQLPTQIYPKQAGKWKAVIQVVHSMMAIGRPVLIGTGSVAASEEVSTYLTEAGLAHRVLNARQDQEEADIIAQAGQRRTITVATNMAGRGTDIELAPGVADLGGLHVLATEHHEAGRIDRQLFGRCGRQGDPGSVQSILSLDDEILTQYIPEWMKSWVVRPLQLTRSAPTSLGTMLFSLAQAKVERKHAHMRKDLFQRDDQLESGLAFSGKSE